MSKAAKLLSTAEAGHTTSPVPDSERLPEPRREFPLIVFMLVPETRVACFVASQGTVGLSDVPPKSPVSFTFPLTEAVASGIA